MNIHELNSLCAQGTQVAFAAGAMLRSATASVVSSIGKDIKIDADFKAHALIGEALSKTGIPVLSEEDDSHTETAHEYLWVVDPLDGSLNFSRGIPNCAVSIALVERGEPIIGIVYDFIRDDLYAGIVGEGASCNEARIMVSNTILRSSAVLMTGFPSHTKFDTEALTTYIRCIQTYKKIRLIGSAALSLAYVASGKADGYFEKDIKWWDVAAGIALVKAAGGKTIVSESDGVAARTVIAYNGKYDITEQGNT